MKQVFLTAATVSQVYSFILSDPRYEEILIKFISNKELRNEFRQHLWVQLCETDPNKILDSYNQRWFIYFYTSVVSRQIKSSTSKWHIQHRQNVVTYIEDYETNFSEREHSSIDVEKGKEIVEEALNHYTKLNPEFRLSADIFREKFYHKKSCRQIDITHKGKKLNKDRIALEIQKATFSIKNYIKKYNKSDIN